MFLARTILDCQAIDFQLIEVYNSCEVVGVNYTLVRKRNMRRIVLRVKDGVVCVSAPPRASKVEIDKFVESKYTWIVEQLENPKGLIPFDSESCLTKFRKIAEAVYPLVADKIKPQPQIYVRDYKSRWGVCYCKRNYIVLNKQLFIKPQVAIEYVILHEYVHFLEPNHGPKFHKIMQELMPDYKERKKLLF